MSRSFLALALLFGTIYVFFIPPFQAPDEDHHFFRSYHVAEGYWVGEKTVDQRFGGSLPSSFEQFSSHFRYLRYGQDQRISRDSIWDVAQIPLRSNEKVFVDFPNVAYYAATAYLPQALFVKIGSLLKLPPLILMYGTRLINLLFWIVIVYISINLIPFQKTLAFLALLPASLVFHAGINADAVTNSLCFLLIAYLLHLVFTTTTLERKHLWLLLISAIITINKVVYAPIFLLSWLIPVRKFKSRKDYLFLNIGLLLFHVALILIWYKIAGDQFIPYDEYNPLYRVDQQLNEGVAPMAQLEFILSNPIEFTSILWNSYIEIFPYTLMHYVGKFGWEGNYLPIWTIIVLLLSMVGVPILDSNKNISLKPIHRLFFIGIGSVMLLAFSVVIYMQWNAPGDSQVTALAGRYFIPIFPFFLLALHQKKELLSPKLLQTSIICIVVFSNFVCIWSILGRYYF